MKASKYDPQGLLNKLDKYQMEAFNKAMKLGSMCIFGDTGFGKTRVAAAIMMELFALGKIKNALICGPKSALQVWPTEMSQFNCPIKIDYLNYEKCPSLVGTKFKKYDLIIADESHRLKNRKSTQSKILWKLGKLSKYRLALSGTPQGNSVEDYWAQFRFVDPEVFGERFKDFSKVFLLSCGWAGKKWKINPIKEELFTNIIHEYSYRITKQEALDLPPMHMHMVPFNLSCDTHKAYEDMLEEHILEINDKEIDAKLAITLVNKLQQICSGFIYDEEELNIFFSMDKVSKLLEILTDEKTVIFCKFEAEIQILREVLKNKRILLYTGKVKNKQIWEEFQNTNNYDIFLANLKTGGTGLNLQSANKLIFFSTGYSYLDFYQARDRVYRRGQTRPVDIYCLYAKNTIEESIYDVLQQKGKSAKAVLDDYRLQLKHRFKPHPLKLLP